MDALERLSEGEIRTIQLTLLQEFAALCAERGYTWFLAAGTLLGAVRHQGFIPWDDDIDVMMPRSDFDQLCSEFRGGVDRALACSVTDRTYPFPFAKYYDSRTSVHEPYNPSPHYGVNIDVFPIDTVPTRRMNRVLMHRATSALQYILGLQIGGRWPQHGRFKHGTLRLTRHLLRFVPYGALGRAITGLTARSRPGATHMGIVCWGYREEVPIWCGASSVDLEFEGYSLPAPAGWHDWLRAAYGDYMLLPPVDQRKSHHVVEASWLV